MIEQTLCILKPDVATLHASPILFKLVAADLFPIMLQRMILTQAQGEKLYEAHVGQPYFARNLEFMLSAPSVVMLLEGDVAIARLRELVGPTDPQEARRAFTHEKQNLRALYGTDLPRNAVHASANSRDAEREIGIFFPRERPLNYHNTPWRL